MCFHFLRKHSNSMDFEYYHPKDADEFTYQLSTWTGSRPPAADLKPHKTLDALPCQLIYKSMESVRSAARIDIRLFCENQLDTPDCGFIVEVNIYRRRGGIAGDWLLTERISGRQCDILKSL